MADFISEEEDGSISLRSTDEDNVSSVTLSADGFSVLVSYLYLLQNKTPEWVEVDHSESIDSS